MVVIFWKIGCLVDSGEFKFNFSGEFKFNLICYKYIFKKLEGFYVYEIK